MASPLTSTLEPSSEKTRVNADIMRKYFRTYGTERDGILGLSEGVLGALMGNRNYLRDTYSRYSVKQIGEFYLNVRRALICEIGGREPRVS